MMPRSPPTRRPRRSRSSSRCHAPQPRAPPDAIAAPERPCSGKSPRLGAVTLDENSIGRSGPDIEHERAVAIYDLLESNSFAPEGQVRGPFKLNLSITGNRLVFDIRGANDTPVMAHLLSLSPLRRIVKDYFMICDS